MSVLLFVLVSACVAEPDSAPSAPEIDPPSQAALPMERGPGAGSGLTYEVYVRSFQDSDGDGVGDLQGVRQRLDHLASLGVETVWLMPVFEAFGPAGYDVTSFDTITGEYGSPEDLAALVADAHARGMRVLLDLPFNHVHRDHPWFVAAESGDPDAHARFRYAPENADANRWFEGAQGDFYYAYFGQDMPDLDWDDAKTRSDMEDIWLRWLDAGADGYRLDAVLMLVEEGATVEGTDASHALVGELVEAARAAHPDAYFLAEASEWEVERSLSWIGTEAVPGADEVLDFPRLDAWIDAAETGEADGVREVVATQVAAGGAGHMASFLGSHDLQRLPARVTDARARRALRVAQFLLPGNPVLYYGEELDLADATTGTGQDWAMRAPMPWDEGANAGFSDGNAWFPPDPAYLDGQNVAAQADDPDSMLQLVRGLACLRDVYDLGGNGAWTELPNESPALLSFERQTNAGRLVVAVNLGPSPLLDLVLPSHGSLRDVATHDPVPPEQPVSVGTLPAFGWRIFGTGEGRCTVAAD